MISVADARKYLFAAISIMSIPSAYAAGFMGAIGSGMSNLLDGGFFVQEFTRLALIVTGFFLLARFSIHLVFEIIRGFYLLKKPTTSGFRMKLLTFLVWLLASIMVAPLIFTWTRLFLDSRLIPSFAVTGFMAGVSAFFVTSFSFAAEKVSKDARVLDDAKNFLTLKLNPFDAKVTAGMVFFFVLISGNFGYHRAIALAIAKPVCISTGGEKVRASIIGQTSFGFVIAKVEEGDLSPFNFPIGVAVLSGSTFEFISAQHDLRISTDC